MNNFFILSETASYLKSKISDYAIAGIFTQEKNKIIFEIQNSAGNEMQMLEHSIEKSFNYLIIRNNYSKAGKNYANLFPEIKNKKILSAEILNNDRLIKCELSDDYKIVFSFFTVNSNCFVIHKDIIVNSFKDSEEFTGMNYKTVFPEFPFKIAPESEIHTIKDFVNKHYRKYGNSVIEEVLSGLGLNAEESVNDNLKDSINKKFEEIDFKLKKPEYLLYVTPETAEISLVPLRKHAHSELIKFDDINRLLTEYIKIKYKSRKMHDVKKNLLGKHNLKLNEINKKISNLKTQLSHCEDAGRLKTSGELILSNLDRISKGDTEKELITSDGEKFKIKLKPELTPAENANNYFLKYKKQKSSVKAIKDKITKAEKEKQDCEKSISELEKEDNIKLLMKEEKQNVRNIKDETNVFRKFILNEKYEVWIGKDSKSNDLLTSRYTLPHEIWFHVRGASGSHTVLKGGNKNDDAPKEFILKAASLAAYYSKARNASSVPVAYCQKKYVKKKKGFSQGSVIMEREKVVFVRPVLPDNG